MTSGKRWGIGKQKRLLLLGKTRGLRLSSTQWNQPRLIEIYLPFTLKKSFCTLYHELCQLWPWGQATRIVKENTVCKGFQNGGMIWKCMVALKEWLLSCYASLREREQHVCSSYWVWKGWGLSWGTEAERRHTVSGWLMEAWWGMSTEQYQNGGAEHENVCGKTL